MQEQLDGPLNLFRESSKFFLSHQRGHWWIIKSVQADKKSIKRWYKGQAKITEDMLPRYDPQALAASGGVRKIPQRQFLTLPIGLQLQALWHTPEGAQAMRCRLNLTKALFQKADAHPNKKIVIDEYKDIFHGDAYLDAVWSGKIKDDDMVLMLSIDGAQLYQSKQSDCWIYIWVILDLVPDLRYKKRHIFPGGFFPRPNKPGNIESFLFPGFC